VGLGVFEKSHARVSGAWVSIESRGEMCDCGCLRETTEGADVADIVGEGVRSCIFLFDSCESGRGCSLIADR
jgi:hypothetical protein